MSQLLVQLFDARAPPRELRLASPPHRVRRSLRSFCSSSVSRATSVSASRRASFGTPLLLLQHRRPARRSCSASAAARARRCAAACATTSPRPNVRAVGPGRRTASRPTGASRDALPHRRSARRRRRATTPRASPALLRVRRSAPHEAAKPSRGREGPHQLAPPGPASSPRRSNPCTGRKCAGTSAVSSERNMSAASSSNGPSSIVGDRNEEMRLRHATRRLRLEHARAREDRMQSRPRGVHARHARRRRRHRRHDARARR